MFFSTMSLRKDCIKVEERGCRMLKKTIQYTDFNNEEVSEDFFFHLSQAELVELELSHKGGLSESLQKIIAAEDGKAIMTEFKNIILKSYGKRSEDGKRFIKNQELRDEFESSEAYSVLFMELVTDADKASEFVNGIVPKGLAEQAAKLSAVPPIAKDTVTEPIVVTRAELLEMSQEDLAKTQERIEAGEVKLGE